MADEITLEFIAQQLQRVLTEMQILQRDVRRRRLDAIRLEGAVTGLAVEMRGIHNHIAHLNERVRKLESDA